MQELDYLGSDIREPKIDGGIDIKKTKVDMPGIGVGKKLNYSNLIYS